MTDLIVESREEVERIRRVADQLCTAHAVLRDRYAQRAIIFDTVILVASAWLTALALIDPRYHQWLVPFSLDAGLWIGLSGVLTFCLSLIQLKTDWKSRSEAHKRSFGMYVEVKREAGYLLASSFDIPAREFQRLAARYDMASDVGTGVPESEFLKLKQRHKVKVEISKLIDKKPSANILLMKVALFWRDNKLW